jgi:hypothetical protein
MKMNNNELNKISAISAITFNTALFIGAPYFLSDYDASAQLISDGASAEVTFFEDMTGRIENGTMVVHLNYSWTQGQGISVTVS